MCHSSRSIQQDEIRTSNHLSIYKVVEERVYDPLNEWLPCSFEHLLETDAAMTDLVDQLKSLFQVNQRAYGLVVLRAVSPLVDSTLRSVQLANSLHEKCGAQLSVVASPFGFISPTIFLNSVSSGILANRIAARPYARPALYLTDARCLPGSEGAGVFNTSGQLVGLITAGIRPKDERAPFNMAPVLPTHAFHAALLSLGLVSRHFQESPLGEIISPLVAKKNTIVLVKYRDTWGSGVLISEWGHVLTNAHLLASLPGGLQPPAGGVAHAPDRFASHSVELRINYAALVGKETVEGNMWHTGTIEYISHTHLDIALLRVHRRSETDRFHHVTCDLLANPRHGTPVAVLGFPLLPPSHDPPISTTHGIVSNIVLVDSCAVSYQTTAPVHSGNSGGGLFDLYV
eukprot:gene15393-18255_t